MKQKLPTAAALIFLLAFPVFALESPPDRFEVSLTLGYGRSLSEGRSAYYHEWSTIRFSHIVENGLLSFDPRAALYGGGFLSFYPFRNFGVQAGFGYLKASMTGSSTFAFMPPSTSSARSERWPGDGELTSVPLCLNLVARMGSAKVQAFASGGIALFLNSVFAGSSAGLGAAAAAGTADERIDAFKLPVAIEDQTWTALGANAGAGLDLRLSKRVAVSVEARYFYCPAEDFAWVWTPGVYEGLGKSISSLAIGAEQARLAGLRTAAMTIRPAFLQISAGVKFFLPGVVRVAAKSK